MTRFSAALLGILLLLPACGSPHVDSPQPVTPRVDPAEPSTSTEPGFGGRPEDASALLAKLQPNGWTDIFLGKALVLADEIRVEGPPGLVDHLALRSDDALFDRQVETTPDGLQITVKPLVPGELVRGQLDNWQLTAIRVITMIENPWAEAVTVTALGTALWQDVDGAEDRADRLVWSGEIE